MQHATSLRFRNKPITKNLVAELLKLGPIEDVEAGVVKYFLQINDIRTLKSKLISELLEKDKNGKVLDYLSSTGLCLDLYDLQKFFELLIPEPDKELNGAVYTPSFIVDYIVNNTINRVGKVCDCSCGSGAFLFGALKKLRQITRLNSVKIIEKYLYGVDITDYGVRRTKILLSLFTIQENEDVPEIKFNLFSGNSLELEWKNQFQEVFEQGGFDFVVGNPPYVRIQDLGPNAKRKLMGNWKSVSDGNYNLYFAFFELGSNILNSKGILGYITPNNYFTSLSGVGLRKYLSEKRQITRVLNFNHLKLFENAQTYTCITILEKNNTKNYFEYYYVDNSSELDKLYDLKFSRYHYDWLDNKKWRLMPEADFANIKKIEKIGRPLGKFCDIRVGIATLKDTVYFTYEQDNNFCLTEFKGKEYPIERGITRKIVKISSVDNEKEIERDKRRIIFPYIKQNGRYKVMTEEYLKENFPDTYKYLLDAKSELMKRDKGKKTYPTWYAWGRTQGMDFSGKRLYTRTFYHRPDFMGDEENNLFCNGYAVFCKKNMRAVQKILNSKIMEYYVKKTSVEIEGNYQCYQKNFIEKFGIYDFTKEEWAYLDKVNDMHTINEFLIKKYEVTL